MLAHGAHAKPERRSIEQPRDEPHGENAEQDERIPNERLEADPCALRAEAWHTRRARRAVKRQTKKEACEADDQQVDRDAHDHLIGAESNRGDGVQKRERDATGGSADQSDPWAAAVVACQRAAE